MGTFEELVDNKLGKFFDFCKLRCFGAIISKDLLERSKQRQLKQESHHAILKKGQTISKKSQEFKLQMSIIT